jgi:hypothetical protein
MAGRLPTVAHKTRERDTVNSVCHRGFSPSSTVLCPLLVPLCYKVRAMKDGPHWLELCQQASVEQDPEKSMVLIQEIISLLDEKEARLRREHPERKTANK